MVRIFLTGGTGFIGRPLTKSLLSRGWDVTALVRKPSSPEAQSLARMGALLVSGDVADRESMRAAMSGAGIVVHNAGQYEYGVDRTGKERMQAVNVQGTENVLGLAHELGVPRTVYVSTVQAFGESGSPMRDETFTRQTPCRTAYEQSKTDAHDVACRLRKRGLPLIIVCPNAVIGANDHSAWGYFQRLYLNRMMPPVCWSPGSVFCCVEVNDAAEGIALAAEKGRIGETYFLNGEPKSFRENLDYWRRRPGAFIPRVWLPAGLAAALFAPLEPLQRILGLPAFISRETVRGASTNWHYSGERMKRELGWTHRSAEEMWLKALDGEIRLLSRREGQSWVQRLKPLETIETGF
ncbi:MAG: NAD-dependent epimerase/dehydratase family protein [Thermoanaerobaculia bacterium]